MDQLHYERPTYPVRTEGPIERVDCGTYIREKLYLRTTADILAPAYVLVPKDGKTRHPAVLVLHDHGAFFLWGKEKVIGIEEHQPFAAR